MPISMLKYIKTPRHVSISKDHHQGVGLYLVKFTELFKNTEFKILKLMIFRILNSVFLNNSVTLTRYRHTP